MALSNRDIFIQRFAFTPLQAKALSSSPTLSELTPQEAGWFTGLAELIVKSATTRQSLLELATKGSATDVAKAATGSLKSMFKKIAAADPAQMALQGPAHADGLDELADQLLRMVALPVIHLASADGAETADPERLVAVFEEGYGYEPDFVRQVFNSCTDSLDGYGAHTFCHAIQERCTKIKVYDLSAAEAELTTILSECAVLDGEPGHGALELLDLYREQMKTINLVHAPQEALGDKLAATSSKITSVAIEQFEKFSELINEALPYIRRAGYSLLEVEMTAALKPDITCHLTKTTDIDEETINELLAELTGKKMLTMVIKSLVLANKAQQKVHITGKQFSTVEMTFGLPPRVTIHFT